MKKKNNKPLVALLSVAFLGVIGATFAYFTSTDTFENVFGTKPYKMEVVETFESPDNWTPGTTTAKTVVATNKGNVDAAVRVSFTESWTPKTAGADPLELSVAGNKVALVNFDADYASKWTKSTEGGVDYYYYNEKLAPNASTTSLIESVTFNPLVDVASSNSCVDDTTNHTRTCTTVAGYSDAEYKLTVKVETVQYDHYKDAWGTTVTIG